MKVTRMTGTIGAHITDIDLSQPLSAEVRDALIRLWHEHLVLVFPGQTRLTPQAHIDFARLFGELEVSSSLNSFSHPEHREIFLLSNEVKDGKPSETRDVGWQWHTDLAFSTRPARGSILHAKAIPEAGGDTMFANMYVAYETLSETMRGLLSQLWAVHDNANSDWHAVRAMGAKSAIVEEFIKKNKPVRQPMVRRHPVTGRESLLLSECFVRTIHGMSPQESKPLLDYLHAHATQPEFVYRHHWQTGDLLMWDNRCTMHKVVADHDDKPSADSGNRLRVLHRVTLLGEEELGVELAPQLP
ncbi:MAG: TauD/TfdA family dioxygenase [Burkholderiales bacterium]|nr:TauD/TfdA family dioxygenase [Burkholderiales bacterium]ODU66226.1 MAG: hypothetical protein ABT05_05890 [Lautropia sp. SCN 66-9]